MMVGNDRGDAAYTAVAALNPNMDKLSPAETLKMKQYFEAMFGADTIYLKDNMDVLPAAHTGEPLSASSGIPGTVSSGAGAGGATATTAPGPVEGKGSVE